MIFKVYETCFLMDCVKDLRAISFFATGWSGSKQHFYENSGGRWRWRGGVHNRWRWSCPRHGALRELGPGGGRQLRYGAQVSPQGHWSAGRHQEILRVRRRQNGEENCHAGGQNAQGKITISDPKVNNVVWITESNALYFVLVSCTGKKEGKLNIIYSTFAIYYDSFSSIN